MTDRTKIDKLMKLNKEFVMKFKTIMDANLDEINDHFSF